MAEYIEREAALESVREKVLICESLPDTIAKDASLFTLASMNDSLNSIPAADVRPVVRGKWETVMLDHERMGCRPTAHYCSECHHITWFRTFFCPNCGADMREES